MTERENSKNPCPSNALADLNDNIITIDEFTNSKKTHTNDRFGNKIKTIYQLSNEYIQVANNIKNGERYLPKVGGTLDGSVKINGELELNRNPCALIFSSPENNKKMILKNNNGDSFVMSYYDEKYWYDFFKFTAENKTIDFKHVNNATINNKLILKQGDYGVGSYGAIFTDENFDEMNVDQSGFYRLGKESKGTFPEGFSEFCSMIHITRSDNKAEKKGSQIIVDTHTGRMAYRTTHVEGFKPWSEFVTTANLAKLAHRFNGNLADKNLDNLTGSNSGFYFQNANISATTERGYPINEAGSLNIIQNDADGSAGCVQIYTTYRSARQFIRIYKSLIKEWGKWIEQITTANSTVDSNGFLKKASPILRLFANEAIEEIDGFKKSGCALINDLATGVTAKRIDVGHYEIHGSLGFAKEGWHITLPEDANGNKKFFAEYSTDENNIITVKTFTKKFDFERCEIVAGEPVDISAGRWVDLRLEMPELVITDKVEPIASALNPVVVSPDI